MQDPHVVIVGAGCFGLSTAHHLLKRRYRNVTILDRSTVLPAPDASSNDINRIVRSSYDDRFYAELAHEAIDEWKDRKFWGDTYHEWVLSKIRNPIPVCLCLHAYSHYRSGVLVLGFDKGVEDNPEAPGGKDYEGSDVVPANGSSTYADESFVNDLDLGCVLVPLPDPGSIRSAFPSGVRTGPFEGDKLASQRRTGYLNRDGGWADAGQGVQILLSQVKKLGAVIQPGQSATKINQANGKVTSVSCTDGTTYEADLLVIATGSWTPSAFPDLDLQGKCLATGHCIAMIQLTKEEAHKYQDCPVVLDFTSGFYVFPPTAQNVIKLAVHGPGFTHTTKAGISTPRTISSDPINGQAIPRIPLQQLRTYLREVYPDLAEKQFYSTRLCWYNDAPDGDWVISRHPSIENLVLATAGSGHAFKFLPVIGRLVADLIEDNLEPLLVQKFAVNRVCARVDGSRSGVPTELDLSQLCSPADLGSPTHA